VVQTCASEIQDGRRPPSGKIEIIEKSPYLPNGLTVRHEIWHDDAVWPFDRSDG